MKHSVNHRPWVNFKELRARLKMEEVLRHYKVEVRRKGEQHQGPCPLPDHTGSKTAHMFSANLARGIFQCFGCKAKGNTLEFAALMEKADVNDGDALRRVAVGLQERFFPEGASSRKPVAPAASLPAPPTLPVLVNEPLDFVLKDLDTGHPWFGDRGLTADTVRHFGLGYCSRGILKGRIAIPLHDNDGRLIGYVGRLVDESLVSVENPLYLFPSKRERQGRVLDFQKSAFLYNGSCIEGVGDDLIVVEEFPSVWWLHQCGFRNAVGLMGSEYSGEQLRILASGLGPSCKARLLPSGNDRSVRMAERLLCDLASHRFVRWTTLSEGGHPTDLSARELKVCFTP